MLAFGVESCFPVKGLRQVCFKIELNKVVVMAKGKITAPAVQAMKGKAKVAVLTCYDFQTAELLDRSVDILLVGDSMGNVVFGHESTLEVEMDDMIPRCRAVARAASKALVVADMPFMSYQPSNEKAIKNAGKFVKKAGAQAVKIEGGREAVERVKAIVNAGIPVMGHIGLTPQSVNRFGGYAVQGKGPEAGKKLIEDAKLLEQAGVFSVVLECVPSELAKKITKAVSIPTIGIGAGRFCDGQVLVVNDILGMGSEKKPKFVKVYAEVGKEIEKAAKSFSQEVKRGKFPNGRHSYK